MYASAIPVSQSFQVESAFTITPFPGHDEAGFFLQVKADLAFNGDVTLSCRFLAKTLPALIFPQKSDYTATKV